MPANKKSAITAEHPKIAMQQSEIMIVVGKISTHT